MQVAECPPHGRGDDGIVLVTDMSHLWTDVELTKYLFKALTEHSAEHDPHDGYLGQW